MHDWSHRTSGPRWDKGYSPIFHYGRRPIGENPKGLTESMRRDEGCRCRCSLRRDKGCGRTLNDGRLAGDSKGLSWWLKDGSPSNGRGNLGWSWECNEGRLASVSWNGLAPVRNILWSKNRSPRYPRVESAQVI